MQPTNAVIYARYSSHGQTEQSIEGQLRECAAFAEKPHCGAFGEPFMYSRTVLLAICSLIVSMISMKHLG